MECEEQRMRDEGGGREDGKADRPSCQRRRVVGDTQTAAVGGTTVKTVSPVRHPPDRDRENESETAGVFQGGIKKTKKTKKCPTACVFTLARVAATLPRS